MALSLSGRKMLGEGLGVLAALSVGLVMLVHPAETKRMFAHILGLTPPQTANAVATAKSDDDNVGGRRGRSVELTARRGGHFFAEAEINGRSVNVMVDTGASMVALTYDDARRAGVLPSDRDFTGQANTANGIAKFAPVEIDRLTIGDVEVRRVRAAVMEDGKLDTTLLGMSFLSKLSGVNMKSGRLVLEE